MDKRTCAVLGAVYFELMNTMVTMAQGEEISKCTIAAYKAAAEQLEELGFRESLMVVASGLEEYNKHIRRVKSYLRLAATDDEELKMEVMKKLNEAVAEANIIRLQLSTLIIELLKSMAKKAEEC